MELSKKEILVWNELSLEWKSSFDIKQNLENQGLDFFGVTPILRKLVAEGLADAKWSDDVYEERGFARKRFYRKKPDGYPGIIKTKSESMFGMLPSFV